MLYPNREENDMFIDDIDGAMVESPILDFDQPGHPLRDILFSTVEIKCYTITLNSKYYKDTLGDQYAIMWQHIRDTLNGYPYYFTFELTKKGRIHAHGIICSNEVNTFHNGLIKIGHIIGKHCYSKYGWFEYMFKSQNCKTFSPITSIKV